MVRHWKALFAAAIGILMICLLCAPARAATPGVVVTEVPGGADAAAHDMFPDGSIAVAATSGTDIIIAKYTPAGKLNSHFGNGGIARLKIPGTASAAAIAAAPGGKILVAGTVDRDVLIARLTTAGQLDSTFNHTGYRKTALGRDAGTAAGVAVGSSGAGFLLATSKGAMAVVKYRANGEIETGYGTGGIATIRADGTARAGALAVRSNGRLVASGRLTRPGDHEDSTLLAQLDSHGRPDNAFGVDGTTIVGARGTLGTGFAMALDNSERILTATTLDDQFAVARYRSNGKIDSDFGVNGLGRTGIAGTATTIGVRGQDISVAGTTGNGTATIARLTSSGKGLDTKFGVNGRATVRLGGSGNDSVVSVTVDSSGRAVIAGATDHKLLLARVTTSGKPDDHFGA